MAHLADERRMYPQQLRVLSEVAFTTPSPTALVPGRTTGTSCDHPQDAHAAYVQIEISGGMLWINVPRDDRSLHVPPGTRVAAITPLRLKKGGWELGDPYGVSVAPASIESLRNKLT